MPDTDIIENDTITAIATPPGRGGVGIVRVSGDKSRGIVQSLIGRAPKPRLAVHTPFLDESGSIIDEGLVLFFPSPNSFTGEDVAEFHGHGGPVVMDMLLTRVIELGARIARPGEFSERAFLNDKLDLVQAEAIADLIDSTSTAAAKAAVQSLQGAFSQHIHELVDVLVNLRVYIESAIDFPEEEIDFLSEGHVMQRTQALLPKFDTIIDQARQGTLLNEGMRWVIAGRPNAGKSSLLNRLAERESAIVTDIPGTTRDVLREYIQIDGLPLHIIDTAGLRETDDIVETMGVTRAWTEIEHADGVLLVVDDQTAWHEVAEEIRSRLPLNVAITIVRNKIDLTGAEPAVIDGRYGKEVLLSVREGNGLELLRDHIKHCAGFTAVEGGAYLARRRHLDALVRARSSVEHGLIELQQRKAGELLAEDLRQAQHALNEITGEFTTDDLLGRIFSTFCIGK